MTWLIEDSTGVMDTLGHAITALCVEEFNSRMTTSFPAREDMVFVRTYITNGSPKENVSNPLAIAVVATLTHGTPENVEQRMVEATGRVTAVWQSVCEASPYSFLNGRLLVAPQQ